MATNDLNPLTPVGADNSNLTNSSGTVRESMTDTLSRTSDNISGQGHARFYSPSNERVHLSGLFDTRTDAEQAVSRLESLGITRSDVSVVYRDEESGATTTATADEYSHGSKAGEGAGAGSMIGGTLGAILGALAATATAVAIPGIGILIAGPVAGALAGAGAGGLTGGLLGALIGAGIPEDTAKTYEAALHAGGIVVVADVPAMRAGEARAILTAQHG
jgi:hypothetical protein